MKTTLVGDVMTRSVVAARKDTSFKDLVRLMHENRVSGLPVLDDEERLIGIVTEGDLVAEEADSDRHRSRLLEWLVSSKRLDEIEARSEMTAGELMMPDVETVGPDEEVVRAAKRLIRAGVKRLPVVDRENRVVGIVSRSDLLRPYLRTDGEIRNEIAEDVLTRALWVDPLTVSVDVEDGIVSLSGEVESRGLRDIVVEMVRRVAGVVEVRNLLTHRVEKPHGTGPTRTPLSGALRMK